jgi:hypothetical protein
VAPNEENLNTGNNIAGHHGQTIAAVKSTLHVEVTQMKKLREEFSLLRHEIDQLTVSFKNAAAASAKILSAGPKGRGSKVKNANGTESPLLVAVAVAAREA